MLVSTKGRYALRVMIDLARHQGEGFIPLRDIAERQDLSQKYLEAIFKPLSDTGMVSGMRGKNGGYKLAKAPSDISVLDVLNVTEGGVEPVSCLKKNADCQMEAACPTFKMWVGLYDVIKDYLSSYSLEKLALNNSEQRIIEASN